jgi:hypothetical protein
VHRSAFFPVLGTFFSGYFPSRGLCPLSPLPLVFIFISRIRLTLIMCILQPFFPSLERFFQALFTLLFASFQFFSILQVLVRGECGVCLHSANLLLLFVLFRFPPSCGGAVGGTLSGVHSGPTNKRRFRQFRLFGLSPTHLFPTPHTPFTISLL